MFSIIPCLTLSSSRSFLSRSIKSHCVFPQVASRLPMAAAAASPQVRHRSNRSRRGLYDDKDIRSGNNVSFSIRATKRKFKPNVFLKRVYSEILDDMLQFHLTASTLRSIDKAGGLDNYLLNKHEPITEGEGYVVKKKILNRLKNQARFDRKAAERGTVPSQQEHDNAA
jgi:large subunit ribosomal protein L28